MSKSFARRFYSSQAWSDCRAAYVKYRGGLCERCMAKGQIVPGEIVHHKIHLTPKNIDDSMVSLNFDNLELLCRECHCDEHDITKRRYKVDELGRVTGRER